MKRVLIVGYSGCEMMRTLHCFWKPNSDTPEKDALVVWGEQPLTEAKRTRTQHPFATKSEVLYALLEALLRTTNTDLFWGQPLEKGVHTLYLPSKNHKPQHSIEGFKTASEDPLALRAWLVPVVYVPRGLAVPFWLAVQNHDLLEEHTNQGTLTLSRGVQYWGGVFEFVFHLLAQHRFIPTIKPHGKALMCCWTPLVDTPEDRQHIKALQQAMPPEVLAGVLGDLWSREALLEHCINSMTDALVRRSVSLSEAKSITSSVKRLEKQAVTTTWVQSLIDTEGVWQEQTRSMNTFAEQLTAWLDDVYYESAGAARVAFRLDEPEKTLAASQEEAVEVEVIGEGAAKSEEGTQGVWRLWFFLQSKTDSSLMIGASAVWDQRLDDLAGIGQRLEGAYETLLTGLGFAARMFEPIKRALSLQGPSGVDLDAEEAYRFLREAAPLLEESGFGVLVPNWWRRPHLGLKMVMETPDSHGGVAQGLMKLKNLVSYKWEISLSGQTLTEEEFDALVKLKSPLVEVRGQWAQLDPEQVESVITFLKTKAQKNREMSLLDAMKMGLAGPQELDGVFVEEVAIEGKLEQWMTQLSDHQALTPLSQPDTLQGTLRPYQQRGMSWLVFMQELGLGACLADDMGLGKTITTLALLLHLKKENPKVPPVLLIAPTSVVVNWAKEAARFAPTLRVMVHQGSDRLQGKAFQAQLKKSDLVLSSYALLWRDEALLTERTWGGVVLDEAQNIKNPAAKQSRIAYMLEGGFRIALTGTPVENRLSELWSIMNFLNAGYLGTREAFRKRLAAPIEKHGDQEALETLRRLSGPFILRRLKTDKRIIQDLPEKTESRVYCRLTEEQASLYEVVVRDAIGQIAEQDGIERHGLVLGMLLQLKQICNHPAQFLHEGTKGTLEGRSHKLTRLNDLLEQTLSVGDRSLIFTQFWEMGDLLQVYLKKRFGREVLFLHGGTPAKKRTTLVERFQSDAEDAPPIFILSIKAGGTGLNLTQANHVFHFDRWWNPAVENQATDRAFRIGQKRNVQVHKFVSVGTLEERIDEMITLKQGLADSVVEAGETWVSDLDTNALRDLVTLRRSELAE